MREINISIKIEKNTTPYRQIILLIHKHETFHGFGCCFLHWLWAQIDILARIWLDPSLVWSILTGSPFFLLKKKMNAKIFKLPASQCPMSESQSPLETLKFSPPITNTCISITPTYPPVLQLVSHHLPPVLNSWFGIWYYLIG